MMNREHSLREWVQSHYDVQPDSWQMISGDASFRRYFRFRTDSNSLIAVDAPPERENVTAFLMLARVLAAQGIRVPRLQQHEAEQGFWVLEDFGDQLLLPLLNRTTVHRYYRQAIHSILQWQSVSTSSHYVLPLYDETRLRTELDLFPQWCVKTHLGMDVNDSLSGLLRRSFDVLIRNAIEQPQRPVHRDFHARNVMVLADGELGIIDFQDAVSGPLTYDLVSLLKDCYIRWPRADVLAFAELYRREALQKGFLTDDDRQRFVRWFDLMGLQRHIKVLGIFCRLYHRDGKVGYLADLPRVLRYSIEAAALYDETAELAEWLERVLVPRIGVMD